jgi:peptidoglycan hydrolase CwlO-like protein/surface antigen
MNNTKIISIQSIKIIFLALIFAVPAVFTTSSIPVEAVTSSELQQQKNDIAQKIKDNVAQADSLSSQVDTLENRIASLDNEITTAQNEITQTESKIEELSVQITQTQTEIDRQKELLKQNLVQMYKLSGSTSMELLLSSDDFSTYINNEEYLASIKDGVKTSVDGIIVQKQSLENNKAEQQNLKADIEARKISLEATRSERSALLEQTQGEESRYRAIVSELEVQQKEINRQLASLSRSISYVGDGSYPWAGEGFPCSGSDPWGMCYRQCVSYTAWKVASTGRFMPTNWTNGRGNARNWVNLTNQDIQNGISVHDDPQPGDVAIWSNGPYGHAMFVEDVYDNGTIFISQYNFNFDGRYSEMVMSTNYNNMRFVRFPF